MMFNLTEEEKKDLRAFCLDFDLVETYIEKECMGYGVEGVFSCSHSAILYLQSFPDSVFIGAHFYGISYSEVAKIVRKNISLVGLKTLSQAGT